MHCATRRCDEIGKTYFRIYDAVDIYKTLEKVNTMKPLVKDPNITLDQLVAELTDDRIVETSLIQSESDTPVSNHAQDVLDQLSQRIMRVLRKASNKAERKPDLRAKLPPSSNSTAAY